MAHDITSRALAWKEIQRRMDPRGKPAGDETGATRLAMAQLTGIAASEPQACPIFSSRVAAVKGLTM
jgi:hypothetical protein